MHIGGVIGGPPTSQAVGLGALQSPPKAWGRPFMDMVPRRSQAGGRMRSALAFSPTTSGWQIAWGVRYLLLLLLLLQLLKKRKVKRNRCHCCHSR